MSNKVVLNRQSVAPSDHDSDNSSAPGSELTYGSDHSLSGSNGIASHAAMPPELHGFTSVALHRPFNQSFSCQSAHEKDLTAQAHSPTLSAASSNSGCLGDEPEEASVHFRQQLEMELHALYADWVKAGRDGFVRRNIINIAEREYSLLQSILDESWSQEIVGNGDTAKQTAFRRCVSADYWPKERKIVAIAPLFEEDYCASIANYMTDILCESSNVHGSSTLWTLDKSIIKTPDVQFCMKYSAVHLEALEPVPGEMVFFCMVAQSHDEFLYHIQKMVCVVPRLDKLQGFFIALVCRAGHGATPRTLYNLHYWQTNPSNPGIEVAVLSYHRDEFYCFMEQIKLAVSFEDWSRCANFMWLNEGGWAPQTNPPEALECFRVRTKKIVTSCSTNLIYRSPKRSPDYWLGPEELKELCEPVMQQLLVRLDRVASLTAVGMSSLRAGEPPYWVDGAFRNVLFV